MIRPMTITEKILAAHANLESVSPGDLIMAKVDIILANDITAPVAIKEFNKIGVDKVFNNERIALIPDHFTPNKDIKAAEQAKMLREFSRKHNLKHYYEIGRVGIEHSLLPDKGIVGPGDVVIGADSHTCTYGALGAFATGVGSTDVASAMATGEAWFKIPPTIKVVFKGYLNKWVTPKDLILHTIGDIGVDGALYKSLEFTGEIVDNMSIDGRITMCNMAIEAGGKNGIVIPDQITENYVQNRALRPYKFFTSDEKAEYERVIVYDVSTIEPTISFPHLPENTKPISKIGDIKIDQVVIGSCTNGRIEDLRLAASILKEHSVHPDVRLIIIPATQEIFMQCVHEGLTEIFVNAGGAFSTPTCGPCLGGHMGILAAGERAISTTNRNFVGRMGDPKSEVYLASPAIAAASAIKGKITSPDNL
ncbi:MAG: 3-isopropylmalate dehydratase large subunit [Cyanobacteriota bacterium]